VEHARGGRVDARAQRGLHAALQQQHSPCGSGISRDRHGARRQCVQLAMPSRRQCIRHQPPQPHQRREQPASGQHRAQQGAAQPLEPRPSHLRVDERAARVEQAVVFDAGRAGRLARAAGEAAVEVALRRRARHVALEHLLDEVDAPARAVELVAEHLVGRAGREAEAAVHALAQHVLRLETGRRAAQRFDQRGVHVRAPGTAGRD
jgi:hypothetical protein